MRSPEATRQPTRVCLICPGLGRVARGYESFIQECFEALRQDNRLDVHLYKGAGPSSEAERSLWNLHRGCWSSRVLGQMIGRDSYYIEEVSFFFSFLPHLIRLDPDVIFFSDVGLRAPLWLWRKLTHQKYRLLLSNGGPVGPPFIRCERVHQIIPGAIEQAVAAGYPAERQSFVPYGFRIPATFSPPTAEAKNGLRAGLGLPSDRPVLLSVGAVNASHKRMDYLIREVTLLATPRPYLLILGSQDAASSPIIRLGNDLLGVEGFRVRTVASSEITAYYQAADLFVLASLNEGFGRVYVEALAQGLPCLAHHSTAARAILGEHGFLEDLQVEGNLSKMIDQLLVTHETSLVRASRHQAAYDRFSWDRLRDHYVEMIQRCAQDSPTR